MPGIISYGTYVPTFRVKVSEIAEFWEKDGPAVAASLGLFEKPVPSIDEDSVTMAVEAAHSAIVSAKLNLRDIGAVLMGSESHPYAVKPSSTTVAEILGISKNYMALDTQFACKAGTGAMQLIAGLVDSRRIKCGLAIGSDTAQAKPGDALEYTAASAAAAFVLGNQKPLADILDFVSISSNTPDFWRRDGQKYPQHAGRFTGEPAYFEHVLGASKLLLKKTKMKAEDFDFAVFHMPNGKFPAEAAKRLGFGKQQTEPGFIVSKIGNPYSASSLIGLAAVLDIAGPGQKIFLCSYGSGAGSDAFAIRTTNNINKFKRQDTVAAQISRGSAISYPAYVKMFKAKEYI